jgi:hypothetical protein
LFDSLFLNYPDDLVEWIEIDMLFHMEILVRNGPILVRVVSNAHTLHFWTLGNLSTNTYQASLFRITNTESAVETWKHNISICDRQGYFDVCTHKFPNPANYNQEFCHSSLNPEWHVAITGVLILFVWLIIAVFKLTED